MYLASRTGRSIDPVIKAQHMREGWLRHRLLEWEEAVDDVTLACLIRLGYNGLQHPREFLRGVSNGDLTSDCTVVNGLDVPFTTRATRHRYRCWTDKKPVIKTATRFFTTHLDADVLQVRSMGTSYHSNKRRGSVAAILKFAFQPLQSDFVEAFNGAGKITLVMVQIPGHFAETGLRALGFQSIRNRQWFSSAVLGIATPILQEEAHQLLLDLPVPPQVVSNLAIERALRDGLISVGAPTITLDRSFDGSERSTESSHRMEAGGMGVPEDRIGTPVSVHRQGALDKPTTEQIEEYPPKKDSAETVKARLALSLFHESDKDDLTFAFAVLDLTGIRPNRREIQAATRDVVDFSERS